jgi:hypothetical protein
MGTLDFIDSGFIITLVIILILCGGIMLYCYRRLNVLENSVIEHGRILQSFIMNSQNMVGGSTCLTQAQDPNMTDLPADEITTDNNAKIDVSDDDSDEDSDDSDDDSGDEDDAKNALIINDDDNDSNSEDDSDSDSDSDSDGDGDNDKGKGKKLDIDLKLVNLESVDDIKSGPVIEEIIPSIDIFTSLSADIKSIDIQDLTDTPLNIGQKDGDGDGDGDGDEDGDYTDLGSDNMEEKKKKKAINKMNVSDLRELAISRNIMNNDDATKLKKADLIKAIQSNP